MDLFSFPPISATLDAAYALLMGLAAILQPIAGDASAAVAIILITLLVRAVLIPTGVAQARAEQIRARLAPRLRALQHRHKNDRERLRRETMALCAGELGASVIGLIGNGAVTVPAAAVFGVVIVLIAAVAATFVPLAAAIYLLVTVVWTLVQRLILRRSHPIDAQPG